LPPVEPSAEGLDVRLLRLRFHLMLRRAEEGLTGFPTCQLLEKLFKHLIGAPRLSGRESYLPPLLRRKLGYRLIAKVVLGLGPGMLEERFDLQFKAIRTLLTLEMGKYIIWHKKYVMRTKNSRGIWDYDSLLDRMEMIIDYGLNRYHI